jgi:hypothetical protein
LLTSTVSLLAGRPSVGEVSDSGALSGPKAKPAKISPIRSVTQEVLRPVMNEAMLFNSDPFFDVILILPPSNPLHWDYGQAQAG